MKHKDIINYDSPWEQILEAAATPESHMSPTATRGLLTENELEAICGVPICVLFADGAPPALADSSLPNPARGAFFLAQAHQKGWGGLEDFFEWDHVGTLESSSITFKSFSISDSRPPDLRLEGDYGDEFAPRIGPWRHRLEGNMKPSLAIIVLAGTNPRRYEAIAPHRLVQEQDGLLMTQMHEMIHDLQMGEENPRDKLLYRVIRERDAENGALTAFQTLGGGSPVAAARGMLSRFITIFNSVAGYFFWPGLKGRGLLLAPFDVYGTSVCALHARAGEPLPAEEIIKNWSLLAAGVMPSDVYDARKQEFDRISAILCEQNADGSPAAVFEGLALLKDRKDPIITVPGARRNFVEKVLQAAHVMHSPYVAPFQP